MNSEPILEVKNLITEFRTDGGVVRAVNDISFSLYRGKTVGIVGESGSGKSVTSLSAMRLIPNPPGKIVSGSIIFKSDDYEVDLVNLSEQQMRGFRGDEIAMIFQEPMTSLNPVHTCGNQVMEAILLHQKLGNKDGFFNRALDVIVCFLSNIFIRIANLFVILPFGIWNAAIMLKNLFSFKAKDVKEGTFEIERKKIQRKLTRAKTEAKKRTIDLFNKVKLPRPEAIFDSYPHQISGGQKQRVMIAMALSCNPSILIADEPTTALDVTVQKTILKLMQELQDDSDMGIIFITHDLGVIAELADDVVVMYKGKIVEQGSVLDIFTKPQHPYTRGLLACRPPLNQNLVSLPTRRDFLDISPGGETIEKKITVEEVFKKLRKNDVTEQQYRAALKQTEPVLEVKNLKTFFPVSRSIFGKTTDYVKAVNDVSFIVYPSETLGLVGESGCGKTTLGRTILKLIEPTEGSITFCGEDITHLSPKEMRPLRRDMQIIFQDPYSSLNPKITIGEAIMEPMRVHGVCDTDMQRKEEVLMLLKRVGLEPEHFYRYPHEFSGGQRQRICIARAIALRPKFIICDESVSALDVSVQADVLNLLNELKSDFGLTYIFISHDLSVVKFMSDRMIVMKNGEIEEEGFPEEIYANPKSDYTRSLINAIPKGNVEDIKANLARKRKPKIAGD